SHRAISMTNQQNCYRRTAARLELSAPRSRRSRPAPGAAHRAGSTLESIVHPLSDIEAECVGGELEQVRVNDSAVLSNVSPLCFCVTHMCRALAGCWATLRSEERR